MRLGESVEGERMREGGSVVRAETWDEAGLGFACDGLTREDDKRGAHGSSATAVIQPDELAGKRNQMRRWGCGRPQVSIVIVADSIRLAAVTSVRRTLSSR